MRSEVKIKMLKSSGPVFDPDYKQRKNPFRENKSPPWVAALVLIVMFLMWLFIFFIGT